MGPAGLGGGPQKGPDGIPRVTEEVYGFWVDWEDDIVVSGQQAGTDSDADARICGTGLSTPSTWASSLDLSESLGIVSYTLGSMTELTSDVGDWEHIRVRTINGTAVSADYRKPLPLAFHVIGLIPDSHNGGAFSAGTTRWIDVPQHDGRPIAYSAAGSHGLWPNPGDHVLAHVLDVFKIVDVTDDDGAVWDTQYHVVPSQFWHGPHSRQKLWHQGHRSWLNHAGTWGNKGEYSCWWFKLVGNCQVSLIVPLRFKESLNIACGRATRPQSLVWLTARGEFSLVCSHCGTDNSAS